MIRAIFSIAAALLILTCGCASEQRETTVVTTETTTVRSQTATPVTPGPATGQCYMLTHDMPLIDAHPQRHLALVPRVSDILPDDVLRGTLPAGTRIRVIQVQEHEGRGGAEARFTFARVETGVHTGATVATDRIGLNYLGSVSTHVQAVPCP